jgi:hypothetical protein
MVMVFRRQAKHSIAPTFVIAGFMKSGTTWLFSTLAKHPQVIKNLRGPGFKETGCYLPRISTSAFELPVLLDNGIDMRDAINSSHLPRAPAGSFILGEALSMIDVEKVISDRASAVMAADTSVKPFNEPAEEIGQHNVANNISTVSSSTIGTYHERMDCFPYVHSREVRR